jgi:hypothetical protein
MLGFFFLVGEEDQIVIWFYLTCTAPHSAVKIFPDVCDWVDHVHRIVLLFHVIASGKSLVSGL